MLNFQLQKILIYIHKRKIIFKLFEKYWHIFQIDWKLLSYNEFKLLL